MRTPIYIVIIAGSVVALVFLVWRLASRRRSLPCPAWLRWMVELDNPFTRTNRAAVIIESLGLEKGMRVLDAGCGPGRLTIPAARQVGAAGEVVALDIQSGMLAHVQDKAAAAGLENIRLLQGGLGGDKLRHGYFDRALLVTVLGEIPDRQAAMREIRDALKPGGLLALTEVIFDPHFLRQRTIAKLAVAAGLRVKAVYGSCFAYTMVLEKPVDEA